MNHSPHPTHHRGASTTTRSAILLAAFATFAAACGSDASGTSDTGQEKTDPTVAESVDIPPVTDEAATAAASADVSAGDIEMTSTIDFEQGGGTWQVTDGADVLGCDGGSFTEAGFAAGAERTMTCDTGARSGTIVLRFAPEPNDSDATEFVSDWTVHAATGDFAGLRGGGDWSGVLDEEGSAAEETWTGSVEFGEPGDEVDSADEVDVTKPGFELDEAFLVALMDRLDVPDDTEGTVTVAVIDADGTAISAVDGATPDDAPLGVGDPTRVGSITKVFTSLATLSLVDDGSIALDDPVAAHVSRVPVPDGVIIRDLLQHTSGIPNYTEVEGFFDEVFEDDARVWTPEEMVGMALSMDADFDAGAEFSYSNTNYIILGVLIEEVTGQPAHEVIRERVVDVVDMPTTYLDGFEDGSAPVAAFTGSPGEPTKQIDFDYTSVATSAWTAGSMVSTGDDLHRLFTSLLAGEIVSDEMLTEMIANEEYGLGVESWDDNDSLIGHGGNIPGYGTLVFHHPESGQTAFFASTSDGLGWGPIVEDTVFAMVPALADES